MRRHTDEDTNDPLFPLMAGETAMTFAEIVTGWNPLAHVWRPDDTLVTSGRRVLVGVAVWSGYDMTLCKALYHAAVSGRMGADRIEFFDVDEVFADATPRFDVLERYLPGLTALPDYWPVPMVGIWSEGVLQQTALGPSGRQLLMDLYGLDLGK
jgi:hypothetical protein